MGIDYRPMFIRLQIYGVIITLKAGTLFKEQGSYDAARNETMTDDPQADSAPTGFISLGPNVIADPLFVEYLNSPKPLPTQESLDDLFRQTTRVRVLGGGMIQDRALDAPVLLECDNQPSLETLQTAMAIQDNQDEMNHCMCLGWPTLEFYHHETLIGTIGMHHGQSIRWSAWKPDADLRDSIALLRWLEERGVDGPMKEYQNLIEARREREQQAQRWREAMPPCLRPFFPEIRRDGRINYQQLNERLSEAYPDIFVRARELFALHGSGAGPWSGYPSYESATEKLLQNMPTETLIEALNGLSLTFEQTEGAARYFAGWSFHKHKPEDAARLPVYLREFLWEHSRQSTNADNVERARRAFT